MSDLPSPVDALFLDFQSAVAGRYSLDRELGRGGMGVVYLAREVHLDRPVAIKLLPPERAAEPRLRERFLREARLAAKLSHPNIIPIHAVAEVEGFVFFVMAYVEGETLAHRVRTRGPLSASDGTRLLREVAWALGHAHGQGLVHRDVKPDNVLIEAGSGRALVADFGIAAATGDAGTDGVAGTPEFMSPEQALGHPVDARSDLYSLGATAFYAFSGRLVFEGRNATELLARHVTEPAPSLTTLGLSVPRRLGMIIDRCLAKEPEHRPTSAAALAEQLATSIEQRRVVPAVLRAFVKRTGRVDGAGALLGSMGLLVGSVATSVFLGGAAGFTVLALGATLGPIAYLVDSARALAKSGFSHDDLAGAFRGELELAREERGSGQSRGSPRLERVLRPLTIWSARVVAPVIALIATSTFLGRWATFLDYVLVPLYFVSASTLIAAGFGYMVVLGRRSDVDTEFWSKVWLGRIGRSLFRIARKLVGSSAVTPAMTHRATELSLGLAAEQLYESLPRETREALADLPRVLRQLQADAQTLRRRHDEVADALGEAGESGGSDQHAELRALRDEARQRLTEAVSALETVRLGLLRLHAGSATVEGFTTHLDNASQVSEEVRRLIEARDEVERALRFPRAVATTPI